MTELEPYIDRYVVRWNGGEKIIPNIYHGHTTAANAHATALGAAIRVAEQHPGATIEHQYARDIMDQVPDWQKGVPMTVQELTGHIETIGRLENGDKE